MCAAALVKQCPMLLQTQGPEVDDIRHDDETNSCDRCADDFRSTGSVMGTCASRFGHAPAFGEWPGLCHASTDEPRADNRKHASNDHVAVLGRVGGSRI